MQSLPGKSNKPPTETQLKQQIKWEDQVASVICKATDKATFIVYNPEKKQFVTFQDIAERGNKAVLLRLSKAFANDQVHVWMGHVDVAGDNVSTSVYFGKVSSSSPGG